MPIVLLGHSMGSLFGQRMLNETADDYDAAILSATAYRTLRHMNSGDLAKRHRVPGGNGHEWLSRDPAVAEWFRDNPLTFDAKVAKLFGIADGLRLLGRPRKLSRDIPMLIMIGSDDPLGGPRSVELLAKAYRERGGLTRRDGHRLPGGPARDVQRGEPGRGPRRRGRLARRST